MNTITILGKTYSIEYVDELHSAGTMGAANRNHQTIIICKDNHEEQQNDTLLHEVIHMISRELMMDLDEQTIARLAVGLHSAGYRVKE